MSITSIDLAQMFEMEHTAIKDNIESLAGSGVIRPPMLHGEEYIINDIADSLIITAKLSPAHACDLMLLWGINPSFYR